jgi:acetyltransferase
MCTSASAPACGQLSPTLAAQLSQIDYDRQMAFVAEEASGAIIGVVRLIADPEGQTRNSP